jgi:hypothetical protein
MSTTPRRARKLLLSNKAKVAKRFPFVIQMLTPTGENKQEIRLGIDSGYKKIGFSCICAHGELLSGELELDNNTSKRLIERRMYRRLRRAKLWYREPRFNNRTKSSDWLAPSVNRRYQTHLSLVKKIEKILPISKITVETGNFDIQKLINPEIKSSEYQEGNLYQFDNEKSFVIFREHGKCQYCGEEKGNDSWRFHHIIGRKEVGTDRVENIALLHSKCHGEIHKNKLEHLIKKSKEYKDASFMNIVKDRFQKDLNCDLTYGYITYNRVKELNLEKSHINDAFVIAGGNLQKRVYPVLVTQKRKNNRCLQLNRKGFAPSVRKQRSKYQPSDLVKINNERYNVIGMFNYGKWIRVSELKAKKSDKLLNFSIKKVISSYSYNSLVFKSAPAIKIVGAGVASIHPLPKGRGLLSAVR